jgi:hypothetical protein
MLLSVPGTARAQSDAKSEAQANAGSKAEAGAQSGKVSQTPVKALQDATNQLLEGLSDKQLRQYRAIRSAHGLIRSVENVRSTIDRAVKACAENNPDMADDLEDRFIKWKRAIRPHLNAAKDKRDDMVVLQSFAEPRRVREHLATFDRAVAYKEGMFETKPVSDAESCKEMMDKMQSTQGRLIKLLKERLALYDQLQGKSPDNQ